MKDKGITLVALVITIIVLLILAGVTISLVVGENGIITKAKEAKQNMENAVGEENDSIQSSLNYMNEEKWGVPEVADPNLEREKFSEIKTSPETITQGDKTAVVPKGFAVGISDTINAIENGLVITDNVDENGYSIGNEFVWIPVEVTASDTETNIASFKRTTTYDGTITDPGSDYTEPYSKGSLSLTNDLTGEYAEYAEMVKSVYHHKGFYVARYEAGCEKERTDTNKAQEEYQGTANPVLSQKNKFVYNYVPWGASMESTAEVSGVKGAVELARGMYPTSNTSYGAVSHLMHGVQWDSIMHFVQDSTHSVTDGRLWGNYKNSTGEAEKGKGQLRKTGYNEAWKAKNMYDIAGNAYELSMEAVTNNRRVVLGGTFSDDGIQYSPSFHAFGFPDTISGSYTFRTVLYMKNN